MKPFDDFDCYITCEEYYGPGYDLTLEEQYNIYFGDTSNVN
jgi:hypothetical protein